MGAEIHTAVVCNTAVLRGAGRCRRGILGGAIPAVSLALPPGCPLV